MHRCIDTVTRRRRDPVDPWLPEGTRVYAIGDIHGRADLLSTLCNRIVEDANGFDGQSTVVFLGDYIDRGPDSRAVIEFLIDDPLPGMRPVFLRGNHEQSLLDFLVDPGIGETWLTYGGVATLASYDVYSGPIPSRTREFVELGRMLFDALPETHLAFMRNCALSHSEGHYFFCHAGIRPGTELEKQSAWDLLRVRETFTDSTRIHEKIIVHGHTVTDVAELLPNRIGIDTGAYDSGILTCVALEGDSQRLIQT